MINSPYAQAGMTETAGIQARQSPLDAVGNTLEGARSLVMRIEELADRLCGQRPPVATVGKTDGPSNGMLESVRDHAEVVAARITDGHRAIGRIEDLL